MLRNVFSKPVCPSHGQEGPCRPRRMTRPGIFVTGGTQHNRETCYSEASRQAGRHLLPTWLGRHGAGNMGESEETQALPFIALLAADRRRWPLGLGSSSSAISCRLAADCRMQGGGRGRLVTRRERLAAGTAGKISLSGLGSLALELGGNVVRFLFGCCGQRSTEEQQQQHEKPPDAQDTGAETVPGHRTWVFSTPTTWPCRGDGWISRWRRRMGTLRWWDVVGE